MFEDFEKQTDLNFIKMGDKVNKYWALLEASQKENRDLKT